MMRSILRVTIVLSLVFPGGRGFTLNRAFPFHPRRRIFPGSGQATAGTMFCVSEKESDTEYTGGLVPPAGRQARCGSNGRESSGGSMAPGAKGQIAPARFPSAVSVRRFAAH